MIFLKNIIGSSQQQYASMNSFLLCTRRSNPTFVSGLRFPHSFPSSVRTLLHPSVRKFNSMYSSIESARSHPHFKPNLPWVWAIYPCSYQNDEVWERIISNIHDNVKRSLEYEGKSHLLPFHDHVVFNDKAKLRWRHISRGARPLQRMGCRSASPHCRRP